ncbi:MAG: T9SS type A sorting domain-containing protein [Candidatus Cloacimonadaceae bacterium]|jgi:hypothetical protein
MKKCFLFLIMVLMLSLASAIIVETGSFRNFLYGTEPACAYDNWVSHIAEGLALPGYNHYAPYDRQTNGFGNFRTINALETIQWKSVIDHMLAGDYLQAEAVIQSNNFPYQVVQFNDTETRRTYYLLREDLVMSYIDDNGTPDDPHDDEIGSFAYAWGLYLFNPNGTRPIIITAPHPCDDFPTPAMAALALKELDPRFMIISGAGREAKWTQVAPYYNSKSLSDPTRVAAHPFNYAYEKMAAHIRDEYNMREFSLQIHSYDYDLHVGYPNNQISAGNKSLCPNLPIRDLSGARNDMINQAPEYIHPANTIGTHEAVHITDFYGVHYNIHDFTWSDGVNEYPVNDKIDLPGYAYSTQMLYTLNGWNDYDVYDPWFHIEMDELPICYEQTENNFNWFYGWDETTQQWSLENRFTKFLQFYSPWVYHLKAVIDDTIELDNDQDPTAVENLAIVAAGLDRVTLSWDRCSDFDFDGYEILYATEPIGEENFSIFNRTNDSFLASQACESSTVTGLTNDNVYYFKIRGIDKNGNYSSLSNEVSTSLAPAYINSFAVNGMHQSIRVAWNVAIQNNNQGFKIYRKSEGMDYEMVDSWLTNPALAAGIGVFEWWDLDVANHDVYTYLISSTNTDNVEYMHNFPTSGHAMPVHTISIRNGAGSLTDSITFGNNQFASDSRDSYWDITKSNPSGNYVWNAFWQPSWGQQGTHLSQEVKGGYDVNNELKTWTMRTRSNQTGPLTIEVSDTFNRGEKLWLADGGNYHNLLEGPYTFNNANSNVRAFTLFWGNMQPAIRPATMPNQVLQGGNNVTFSWNYTYPFLVEHVELSLQNETDSLLVSSFMTSAQSSVDYTIPQQANMPNTKLIWDMYAVDGVHTRFVSPYTFALIPGMNNVIFVPGWQTMTNPWPEHPVTVAQAFGDGTVAYSMGSDGNWVPAQDFLFNSPIWVNPVDVAFFGSSTAVQGEEFSVDLQDGWNLIGNPHLCIYDLESLRFIVNGKTYRFGEMVNQGLVSNAIYVFKEGRYQLAEQIEPFEAFYIKYYASDQVVSQVNFFPYWESYDVTPPLAQSCIDLFAETGSGVDWVRVGTHDYIDTEVGFRLNLPKAPEPPFDMPRMYLNVETDPTGRMDHIFQSLYKSPLETDETIQQIIEYSVVLDLPNTDPVTFSWGENTLPENWQIGFFIEDNVFYNTHVNDLVFEPAEAGVYECIIRLSNYIVPSDRPVVAMIGKPLAYPNPFNPDVNIAFSLAKAGNVSVDVYNIRGQKVRNLSSGAMQEGNHTLHWNGKDKHGRNVASGVYFVMINSGKHSQSVKVMLMK